MFCQNCGSNCHNNRFCSNCGHKIMNEENKRPPCHQDCKNGAHSSYCCNRHNDVSPNLCFEDIDNKGFDWVGLLDILDSGIVKCMKMSNGADFLYMRNNDMKVRTLHLDRQSDLLYNLMRKLNTDVWKLSLVRGKVAELTSRHSN